VPPPATLQRQNSFEAIWQQISPSSRNGAAASRNGSGSGAVAGRAFFGQQPPQGRGAGLVGLRNLGNTCFMAACLQCLVHTELLTNYFLDGLYETHLCPNSPTRGQLAQAFADLVAAVHAESADAAVSPANVKRLVAKYAPHFAGYNQQDCQEFMRFLLDGLAEELSRTRRGSQAGPPAAALAQAEYVWAQHRARNDSIVTEMFCGQLESRVQCQTCHHVSLCYDPFFDLSVPIPKGGGGAGSGDDGDRYDGRGCGSGGDGGGGGVAAALGYGSGRECLRAFSSEEVLDGDDKYACSRCRKRRRSVKRLTVHRFPPVLAIHLKRFQYTATSREKLDATVRFPTRGLDLAAFATRHYRSHRGAAPVYDLYGVANHSGGLHGGHYTAHCLSPRDGCWYNFNDESVTRVDAGELGGPAAYVLFYKLREV
ncbi:unnamed protein product, partial [Phaeothamnion confervicola]